MPVTKIILCCSCSMCCQWYRKQKIYC